MRQIEQKKAEESRLAQQLIDLDAQIVADAEDRNRMKQRAVTLRAQLQAETAMQAEMQLARAFFVLVRHS